MLRKTFCWLAEMKERSGEDCLVMVFLRGAWAWVWKLRKAVCEALGACLSAFTTAKGRLSINAMLSRVCEVVDGDGRCRRWPRWTMRELYLLYVTMSRCLAVAANLRYGLRRLGNFENASIREREHHKATSELEASNS